MSASSTVAANSLYSNDGGATDVRPSLMEAISKAPSPEMQSTDALDPENKIDHGLLLPTQESNNGTLFQDTKSMSDVSESMEGTSADHTEQVHVKVSEICALKTHTAGKKTRRRGGKARKNITVLNCYPIESYEKKGHRYSRLEMEVLRFQGMGEQKKRWVEVYCGLGPSVQLEYDGLVVSDKTREEDCVPRFDFDFDPRSQFQKSNDLGKGCSKLVDNDMEGLITSETSSCLSIRDEIGCSAEEEECSEVDDSDDDYSSIQRPAFLVTGEPDFDSGPPQDGLEYLRRVRWEAVRIPKVTIAKVNKIKEQSVYMPQIPDIMKCPENIMPLMQWEDSFIADFSELRQAFSRLDPQVTCSKGSTKKHLFVDEDDILDRTPETNTTSEKFVTLTLTDDIPTLSKILKMDFASRTSILKKRISCVENTDTLSRDETLWLFALCVAIDCPLDGDTSAALRSLLRKCARMRAVKKEVDDEVALMNILVAICGRYFGQSGS